MTRPVPLHAEPTGAGGRKTAGRGAPRRVADVQRQTRRGLLVAAGFMAAAVITGITIVGADWWLPLHLIVVGALLSAISATTQMLAVTWSAAPAPSPLVAGAQRWALAVGAVALVVGRETDRTSMFVTGGTAVIAAMLGLAAILLRVRHHAVTPRFAPAIEAYVAAAVTGAIGMSIGLLLGTGRTGRSYVELRDVHLVLNVLGLVGLVIAGTLPYFAATQVRNKMSPRATPTAMRITFAALFAATVIAATGHLAERPGVAAGGLIVYGLGLLTIAAMLPIYARSRLRWAGPRLVQLVAGVAWWVTMTVALAVVTIHETDDRAILRALVVGGFAQILVASLAYLGPVLRGGGHQRLGAGFATTRSWVSLAAGNTAAVAALAGNDPTLAVALAIWLADVAIRAARLVTPTRSDDHV
jgi:nitrite reductase (NO-forming)